MAAESDWLDGRTQQVFGRGHEKGRGRESTGCPNRICYSDLTESASFPDQMCRPVEIASYDFSTATAIAMEWETAAGGAVAGSVLGGGRAVQY